MEINELNAADMISHDMMALVGTGLYPVRALTIVEMMDEYGQPNICYFADKDQAVWQTIGMLNYVEIIIRGMIQIQGRDD